MLWGFVLFVCFASLNLHDNHYDQDYKSILNQTPPLFSKLDVQGPSLDLCFFHINCLHKCIVNLNYTAPACQHGKEWTKQWIKPQLQEKCRFSNEIITLLGLSEV